MVYSTDRTISLYPAATQGSPKPAAARPRWPDRRREGLPSEHPVQQTKRGRSPGPLLPRRGRSEELRAGITASSTCRIRPDG